MIKIGKKRFYPERARAALREAREMTDTTPSPLDNMTEAQIIEKLRQTREELWNAKKSHYRRK